MDQQELLSQITPTNMLGRYRILRRLGRGGMGEVWLCEDQRLDRQVAVKTLPAQNQQDHTFIQRFEREAKAAAALNHPHILPVHDYGKQPLANERIITYIVMPYIQGGSLSERIAFYTRQRRLMPYQEALNFLSQAASAIDYAHKQRLIHRDIKPDNMLLRDENWLLLADFGIARMLTGTESLTTAGNGIGTPEFMAPEQARGQAHITSDNYSLAVVAYLLFTGRLPFQGESAIAISIQHLIEEPPPPRQFNPSLSPATEQLLLQSLAKDPAERPALASDFVTQLERSLHDAAYQPTALPTIRDLPALAFQESVPLLQQEQSEDEQHPRHLRLSRRQLLATSAITATAVAGGALGTWGIMQRPSSPARIQLPAQPNSSARPRSTGKDKPVLVLTGHSKAAYSLVWSQDANYLVSAGSDNQVLFWNLSRLRQQPDRPSLTPLYDHQLRCNQPYNAATLFMASSPDRTRLAIANLQITDTDTQITLCTPDFNNITPIPLRVRDTASDYGPDIDGMAWVDDQHLVFAHMKSAPDSKGSSFYQLYLINTQQTLYQLLDTTQPYDPDVQTFTSVLSSFRTGSLAVIHKQSIVVGQINTSGQPAWHKHSTIDLSQFARDKDHSAINMVDWSADGRYLVVLVPFSSATNTQQLLYIPWQEVNPVQYQLKVPDYATDRVIAMFSHIACNPADLSPGVAAGTTNGDIYLWDFREHSSFASKLDNGGITGAVTSLAWSPDGHWLAAGFEDSNTSILVWKIS
ncbi:hypothetical protein KSF_080740 [Reticulibacter mediterranei]|uniref:non-specific serine/threonine protein kinase n=1 Tax=Reticulibacter mediterranei TaxID=2778369 RepID=A0A8J3IXT2_9CHLR|nr:serine/threonine-protein kinase [Reticulibacter mediterranei]GHO98026.1 hypothetical protein KSF_080740 [Reticulibacter mediterranei]